MNNTRTTEASTRATQQHQFSLPCLLLQDAPTLPPESGDAGKFDGTENPRHLRVIHALMQRPLKREHVDNVAGCSNGPQLISDLRDKGLAIPCALINGLDRDGRPCKFGVYSLTDRDRRRIKRWQAQRKHKASGGVA